MSTHYLITYYWEGENGRKGHAYDIATDPIDWVIRVNEDSTETYFLLNAEQMTREQVKHIDENGLMGT